MSKSGSWINNHLFTYTPYGKSWRDCGYLRFWKNRLRGYTHLGQILYQKLPILAIAGAISPHFKSHNGEIWHEAANLGVSLVSSAARYRYVSTVTGHLSQSPQDSSLQALLSMTLPFSCRAREVTCHYRHVNRFCYLLTPKPNFVKKNP